MNTRECKVLRTNAAAAMVGSIVAILGSSRWDTKVARCWRHWRTFWKRLKVKSPIGISDETALTQLQIVL